MLTAMKLTRAAVVAVVVFVGACVGQAPRLLHPTDPSTDFYEVSPGIFRGGRLDQAGVERLATLGVKTIVNLENDDQAIANEKAWAAASQIVQVSTPMSGQWAPSNRQVNTILATLADHTKYPIYIHCKKGMDRTGVIVALHRVVNEGWTPARAELERDKIGFNHWLVFLDRYYDRFTHKVRHSLKLDVAGVEQPAGREQQRGTRTLRTD